MDFTEIFKQSSGLVSFSPGAHFLLTAATDRVIIRRADTFQISRSWAIDPTPSVTSLPSSSGSYQTPTITHLEWSSDSEFVLAACAKAGVVHVFRMSDERWHAKIEAGVEGLVKAEWAPDGRHIICFSEWAVSVSLPFAICHDGRLKWGLVASRYRLVCR